MLLYLRKIKRNFRNFIEIFEKFLRKYKENLRFDRKNLKCQYLPMNNTNIYSVSGKMIGHYGKLFKTLLFETVIDI